MPRAKFLHGAQPLLCTTVIDPTAPAEAHFKDVLDVSDLINQAPLSHADIPEMDPAASHFRWLDPFEANKVDPCITNPAAKTDPLDLMGSMPKPLLDGIEKNMTELGDAIPEENQPYPRVGLRNLAARSTCFSVSAAVQLCSAA